MHMCEHINVCVFVCIRREGGMEGGRERERERERERASDKVDRKIPFSQWTRCKTVGN